jgi:hypothetical protein
MGIESMISRNCKQTAVYWGTPINNGEGGFTFADPVEIQVRWENKLQLITDNTGNEIVAKSVIYTTQDLEEEGMLCLGTIAELDLIAGAEITVDDEEITVDDEDVTVDDEGGSIVSNPKQIEGAFSIKRFDKTPDLKGTEFIRKAYL